MHAHTDVCVCVGCTQATSLFEHGIPSLVFVSTHAHTPPSQSQSQSPLRITVYVAADWQPLAHDDHLSTVWRGPGGKIFARNMHHVKAGWSTSWQVHLTAVMLAVSHVCCLSFHIHT